MRDIWVRILQTGGAKIYGIVTGVVTLSLTARWLGPEGRGEVAAITTWAGVFATVGYLSLGQVAIHRASNSEDESWLKGSLSALLFFCFSATLLGWLVAAALFPLSNGAVYGGLSPTLLALGFLLLPFNIWEQYGSSLLMALERLHFYNRFQVIGRSATVIGIVVMIPYLGLGVMGVLLAYLIGQFLVAVGGIGFLVSHAKGIRRPAFSEIMDFLKGGGKLHLNAIGAFLYTSTDVLMLNYYRVTEETGYYQLGMQLMGIMMILPQAAAMVIYGKVSSKGANDAWAEQKKILMHVMLLLVFAALFAGVTAQWWLIWLAGKEFLPAVDIFRWQLLSVIGMSFSILMAPQWIGRGFFLTASFLTLFVGLGNVVANIFLIPKYGMYGAIWASLGVYMFAILGNGLMAIWSEKQSVKLSC